MLDLAGAASLTGGWEMHLYQIDNLPVEKSQSKYKEIFPIIYTTNPTRVIFWVIN